MRQMNNGQQSNDNEKSFSVKESIFGYQVHFCYRGCEDFSLRMNNIKVFLFIHTLLDNIRVHM